MSVPEVGPCGWEPAPCGPLPEPDDESYEPLREAAAGILWALSGRRFGTCELTVRPCRQGCSELYPGATWPQAALVAGAWVNMSCGLCPGICSCRYVDSVRLPGPVYSLVDVKVDGASVTGAARVVDQNLLIRTDGNRWPTCQNMAAADTEEDTWSVTYLRGEALPPAGERALGELMSEMWLACGDDGKCKLPRRVQTITRQGMTMGFLDPMDFLARGKVGLYFTDLWLSSVNPQGRPSGARVLSPDAPRHYQDTWP